jgi:hypothetical protein
MRFDGSGNSIKQPKLQTVIMQQLQALWQAEARATAAEAAVAALQAKLVDHVSEIKSQSSPEGTTVVCSNVDAISLELHKLTDRLATPDAAAVMEDSKTLRLAAAKLQASGPAFSVSLSVRIFKNKKQK